MTGPYCKQIVCGVMWVLSLVALSGVGRAERLPIKTYNTASKARPRQEDRQGPTPRSPASLTNR